MVGLLCKACTKYQIIRIDYLLFESQEIASFTPLCHCRPEASSILSDIWVVMQSGGFGLESIYDSSDQTINRSLAEFLSLPSLRIDIINDFSFENLGPGVESLTPEIVAHSRRQSNDAGVYQLEAVGSNLSEPSDFNDFLPQPPQRVGDEVDHMVYPPSIDFIAEISVLPPNQDFMLTDEFGDEVVDGAIFFPSIDSDETADVNNWRSHGGVAPVQNVVDQLTLLTASVRPNLTDSYGSGVLRVYALNIDDRRHDAIVTAIIKPPPGFGGRDSIRVAIGMSWGLVDDEWRLFSVMNNYVLGPEFLDPHPEVVAGLYPRWEPYGPR